MFVLRYCPLIHPCVVPLFTLILSRIVSLCITFAQQDKKLIYQFTKYGHIGLPKENKARHICPYLVNYGNYVYTGCIKRKLGYLQGRGCCVHRD